MAMMTPAMVPPLEEDLEVELSETEVPLAAEEEPVDEDEEEAIAEVPALEVTVAR